MHVLLISEEMLLGRYGVGVGEKGRRREFV